MELQAHLSTLSPLRRPAALVVVAAALLSRALAGCNSTISESSAAPGALVPTSDASLPDEGGASSDAGQVSEAAAVDPLQGCSLDPGAPAPSFDPGAAPESDPVSGPFTLERALQGLPGAGVLTAQIQTDSGAITCTLAEQAAPISVANFVGLARGLRPYYDEASSTWKASRFYDGLKFHRLVPDFVIQGGDPLGNGTGGPGYDLPNENHAAEILGALAMAAGTQSGDGGTTEFVPSGSQFYIVVGHGPAPDYNVFGECTVDVAKQIAAIAHSKDGTPKAPVFIRHVVIARCQAK